MIYSKSCQYAIRAVIRLGAMPVETLCRLEEIATQESIPQQFLAKIMQRLAKKRIVRSLKGKKGGFALLIPADKITLFSLVEAIDDLSLSWSDCILGKGQCSQESSCALHEAWKDLRERHMTFLQSITVADIVASKIDLPAGNLRPEASEFF